MDKDLNNALETLQLEIRTQAEFEFEVHISPKCIPDLIKYKLNQDMSAALLAVINQAFIAGAEFGFLKTVENSLRHTE